MWARAALAVLEGVITCLAFYNPPDIGWSIGNSVPIIAKSGIVTLFDRLISNTSLDHENLLSTQYKVGIGDPLIGVFVCRKFLRLPNCDALFVGSGARANAVLTRQPCIPISIWRRINDQQWVIQLDDSAKSRLISNIAIRDGQIDFLQPANKVRGTLYDRNPWLDPGTLLDSHSLVGPYQRAILKSTDSGGDNGEYGYPYGRVGRSTGKTICGFFIFALGAALMKLAFYFGDAPRPQRDDRWLTCGTGLIAVLRIGQGTILALSGNWLRALQTRIRGSVHPGILLHDRHSHLPVGIHADAGPGGVNCKRSEGIIGQIARLTR